MSEKHGKILRDLRNKKSMTQKELAEKLNRAESTIGMWEQGRREMDYDSLCTVSEFFNVTIDELLGLPARTTLNDASKVIPLLPEQQELIQKIKEIRDPMTLAMINGYTDAITAQIKQNKKDAI